MKKNIFANFIGKFWGILSNFLFIPLYIHYLGFESFSIISFTLVIAGIMAILDAGLTATLSREFARVDISKEEKIRVFKALESAYIFIVVLCISVVYFLSYPIAENWINLDSYEPSEVSFFFKIISFDIGFQLLLRFYIGGLLGLENQVRANAYQVGWGMLRNGFVVIAIIFLPTLETFFLWQTVSTIIVAVLVKVSLEKLLLGQYSIRISTKIELMVFKRVWKFAGGMLLIAFVAALNTQMDKIVISKILSLERLGYYTLAVSISQVVLVLVNPIATALLPRFTAQYSAGKNEEASNLFNTVNVFISALVFSVMAILTFFGKEIIWIWTGKLELAIQISKFMPVMALAYAMLSLQVIPYYIAIANGYTKINNVLGIISLILTLPGYWYGVQYFGAIGAAVIFCIVQVVSTFVYLYFINRKFIKSKIVSTIYFKQILIPLTLTIGIAYVLSLIPNLGENNRLLSLLWIGICSFLTLISVILIIIPFKELKKWIDWRIFTREN